MPKLEDFNGYVFKHINNPQFPANDQRPNFDKRGDEIAQYISLKIINALNSNADGASGADYINCTPISGVGTNETNTVQLSMEALKTYVDNMVHDIVIGQIPKGSIDNSMLSDIEGQIKDTVTKHLADYASYASAKDGDIYTVVDFKRSDTTLYLKSTLSNKDGNGYFQTCTIKEYDSAGITVIKTTTWTFTYDADGNIITKVVA